MPLSRLFALTREPSPALGSCELTHLERQAIDLERARAQHRAYESLLAELGCELLRLPAEPELPDSVFVEDVAVVLDELAVITRPGAPSRRPEAESVARALVPFRELAALREPGRLDGGDVLAVGRQLFVGISARTNRAGLRALAETAEPLGYAVTPVAVPGALHLKSAVTAVDERTLVGDARRVDRSEFDAYQWLDVPPGEERAANVLAVGGGRVLVAAGCERTAEMLEGAGLQPVPVDASEFAKADGALTCLSLRW